MSNLISCRLPVYQGRDEAYPLLAEAGIGGIELSPPADGDYERCRALAETNGLCIASVATGVELGNPESVAAFTQVLEKTASIRVSLVFVSVKGKEGLSPEAVLTGFGEVCDSAADLGITLSMETHPPFGTNARIALETIAAVARPNLGYNFDTANLYYYNAGADTVAELKLAAPRVTSVHLKDTDGSFKTPNFPVLGQGVVDFPEVFRVLGARGFTGPYTLELEGPLMRGKDLDERHAVVLECMTYLRSIGAVSS